MSFLPARMARLLIGGHQSHLAGAIETLHAQGVLHIEEYADPTGTTRMGTPLAAGESASADLVALRGLAKAMGADGAAPGSTSTTLAEAQAALQPALDRAATLRTKLSTLDSEESTLRPLAGLDLDLGLAASLRSVKLFVGSTRSEPLIPSGAEATRSGAVLAVVAPLSQAAATEKALAAAGFSAATVPAGTGVPAQRLAALQAQRIALVADLAKAEGETALLRAAWAPRLAALEAQLSSQVEQTQAPLQFGLTKTTFHIEGWVPVASLDTVRVALKAKFGEQLYLENLGDAPMPAHAEHHGHGEHKAEHGAEGHGDAHAEAHHAATSAEEAPVHLVNKGIARPYEFFLGLLGKPRYQEIDPTKLMLVFFPLFFGLMVGDVAVGLLIMAIGLFLKKNHVFGIGGPAVGRGIFMGGLMSAIVGLFVFGEALGIHFVVDSHAAAAGELSWENILGLHIPDHGFLYKTGGEHLAAAGEAAAGAMATHASETTGLVGILAPHSDTHLSLAGIVNLGYYSKVHDTLALLVWGMLIGLVHIILGLILGYRNVAKAHGHKLAIQEKGAWLLLMAGGATAFFAWGSILGYLGVGLAVASVALLYMGAAHVIGVGFIALLEIPGLAGNVLSYTRLAAIGASKAGMAIAFGNIAFVVIAGHDGVANTASILGWVVYILAFSLILVLSIIAGTLQSLRLQFVEFFGKFYQGGGRPYVPFGRRAKQSS
ncbi:MAG: hypothetical protein AABX89_03655 [Candidatus Thermoplasmatota archaeon]